MNDPQELASTMLVKLDQVLTKVDTMGQNLRNELARIKVRLSGIESRLNVFNESIT